MRGTDSALPATSRFLHICGFLIGRKHEDEKKAHSNTA